MSKSVTEQRSHSDIFVCERCKHPFIGYVANGNKRFCNDCKKENYNENQNKQRGGKSKCVHFSHARQIIDGFISECSSKGYHNKKFIKISEILFWVKEHPEYVPEFWTSGMVIRRWITQTLKTQYPYKQFSTDVYIRDD